MKDFALGRALWLPLADFEIPWRHLVSVCVTTGIGDAPTPATV
jgi:hypothetical protein